MEGEKVAVFYLPDVKFGGWPTYTAHLFHGLVFAGYSPTLYRIGARTENRVREWGRGINYQNVSLTDAVTIASVTKTLISATTQAFAAETDALVQVGAKVIIHDPTELKGEIPEILKNCRDVITIRPINVANLAAKGIESRYLPHPYVRYQHMFGRRMLWAAAFSRIDWDKGTHHIVAANDKLPTEKQIRIFGAANTMYAFHKLPQHWVQYYNGTFPADDLWQGAKIASRYKWAVDMSTISGDGGGTQYTFLEAIDAGTALMLNENWRTNRDDDEMANAATFVKAEDLADAIQEEPKIFGEHVLDNHDAVTIAKQTVDNG